MKILKGYNQMSIGYGDQLGEPPPVAAQVRLSAGSEYEMSDWSGWHTVKPETECLTLMVTGKRWENVRQTTKPMKLRPLSNVDSSSLLLEVSSYYLGR